MSAADPLLDRAAVEDAFRRLGDRLSSRGIVADLYIFGGAAMALAYDARRATRDIDAVFQPHGVVLEEAAAVARDLGLPQLDRGLRLRKRTAASFTEPDHQLVTWPNAPAAGHLVQG